MIEEEAAAATILADVVKLTEEAGIVSESSVARARDIGEEIANKADEMNAEIIVVSLPGPNAPNRESLQGMVDTLLQKAHCEVIVMR
jgi:nucleotide-binding universal stress UspA family protein